MTELKRATVKCHGKFKTSLSINRNGVSISFKKGKASSS